MKKVIYLFIISLIIFSCKNLNNSYEIVRDIEFSPGFNSKDRFIGIFNDRKDNKEYIYFADRETGKCIKTFSIDGELIDSIPISNIFEDYEDEIDNILVISKDSIILLTSFTNKAVIINNKAEILYKLEIDSIVKNDMDLQYEFYPSFLSNATTSADILLFRVWENYSHMMEKGGKRNSSFSSQALYCDSQIYKMPYFLKVSNFATDGVYAKFGLHDFYKDIYGDENGNYNNAFIDIIQAFKRIEDYIYIINSHSDMIYRINIEDLTIVNKFKIESKFTSVANKQFIMSETKDSDKLLYEYLDNEVYEGYISNIFFNKKDKEYYLIVNHSLTGEKERNNYGPLCNYRPFSVIIYDNDFKNPREYKFEGNIFYPDVAIMTEEGLMILKKNEYEDFKDFGKKKFSLLKFN